MPEFTSQQTKNLEMIQSTISRMATHSFALKGWAITLAAALAALMLKEKGGASYLLGVPAMLCFWGLDAYYLRQERLFRGLFRRLANAESEEAFPRFTMQTFPEDASSWARTLFSRTLFPAYAMTLLTMGIAALLARAD